MVKLYLLVFFGRMIDVSIGTIRTYTSVKGKKRISFILGFFEALLYFLVIRSVLVDKANLLICALLYSFGYAFGVLFGTYISHTIINEEVYLQIVINDNQELLNILRRNGYIYSTTSLDNTFDNQKRRLIFFKIENKKIPNILKLLSIYDDNFFYIVNDIK